ncbi:MAG TPA: class I SAM-dependent methyltransferase [Anaerolineae bacterium]|nr:class I SAM-dependent methyltransferase [Anaerolineae bacterium]
MDAELVNKLLEINRTFYSQFGEAFSDTRSSERLNIEPFQKYLANNIRLLDVGCGNGRLAHTLETAGYSLDYIGVDASSRLIARAQDDRVTLRHIHAQFRLADLTTPNWSKSVQDTAPFDVIIALAVFHHIPSFELRVQVLSELRTLLKPNGIFIMSNWQFTQNERLQKKIVPWNTLGIDPARLEDGDALIDWKRGGIGYRYVHLLQPTKVEQLARASNFIVLNQFYADADMNLFSILQSQ